jgi:glycosyltransferase involved in cell wall biosynthesis
MYKRNHVINASGGAEKILITYANMLTKRGHEVILATRDEEKGATFFPLDKEVIFKHFDFHFSKFRRLIGNTLKKIKLLDKFPNFNRELLVSRMLKRYSDEVKPDVILACSIQELVDLVLYTDYDCPVIMMLHGEPSYYFKEKRMEIYLEALKKVNAVQVLLPSYIEAIKKFYDGDVVAIGNPVYKMKEKNDDSKDIVYMARVNDTKRQHLLIEAFNKIANKHPDWRVLMYGTLKDKKYVAFCENLIKKYGLENQIFFKGETKEVEDVLRRSEICAFPSKFEGFSLAQTEAMAVGLPVIGFDYCCGVNELIKDGENGFLVKDIDEFTNKLDLLISNKQLRRKMGIEARKISDEYAPESIMEQWENLMNNVIEEKNGQ